MLLYWGMFTAGFTIGAILSFMTFAPKKPEEDGEYETEIPYELKDRSRVLFSAQSLNQSHQQKINPAN